MVAQPVKPVKHPAKYSPQIVEAIRNIIAPLHEDAIRVLDPFGGVGGIFDITNRMEAIATCVEIEPEWAAVAIEHAASLSYFGNVECADFFKWADTCMKQFDFVITSPTYGNRMADHHEAREDSKRNTYRHVLGRPLSENSSAAMQWGAEYRAFHMKAWAAVFRLVRPGGYFILNVKDHIRKDAKMPVTTWHKTAAQMCGFNYITQYKVPVKGNGQGQNGKVRVDHEMIYVFQKPWQVGADKAGNKARYAEQKIGDQS